MEEGAHGLGDPSFHRSFAIETEIAMANRVFHRFVELTLWVYRTLYLLRVVFLFLQDRSSSGVSSRTFPLLPSFSHTVLMRAGRTMVETSILARRRSTMANFGIAE